MSNIFTVLAIVALYTSEICCQTPGEKRKSQSITRCELPIIEHGTWIQTRNDSGYLMYQLKCDRDYCTSNQSASIECYKGRWLNTVSDCEVLCSKIADKKLLFILSAVGLTVLIIIIITCLVLRRNKKSVKAIPKWKKNQEERTKKFSSEEQEKVYKDLIETSRSSFRFPFFFPKGRSTKKKPIPLEEGGYLVPNQKRRSHGEINQAEGIHRSGHTNNSDFTAISGMGEAANTSKHENLAKEVIKELERKQFKCKISTTVKVERVYKPATNPLYCDLIGGFSDACIEVEDKPSAPPLTQNNRNDDLPFVVPTNRGERKYSPEFQEESSSKNELDLSKVCTTSPSCRRRDLKKQEGRVTDIDPKPESREDIIPGESTKGVQICVNRNDTQRAVKSNQIVRHEEPTYVKSKELANKHLYCNLTVNDEDREYITEETIENSPTPSPLHVYVNLQTT